MYSRENVVLGCKVLPNDVRDLLVLLHLLLDECIRLCPEVANQILGDVIVADLVP